LKLHLQSTDYGNFLADEAGQLTVSIIQDKLLQKFIEQFESMRSQVVDPAATFFDYITYVVPPYPPHSLACACRGLSRTVARYDTCPASFPSAPGMAAVHWSSGSLVRF
jgi:hypothetical protein